MQNLFLDSLIAFFSTPGENSWYYYCNYCYYYSVLWWVLFSICLTESQLKLPVVNLFILVKIINLVLRHYIFSKYLEFQVTWSEKTFTFIVCEKELWNFLQMVWNLTFVMYFEVSPEFLIHPNLRHFPYGVLIPDCTDLAMAWILYYANGTLQTHRILVRMDILVYYPSSISFLKTTSFNTQIYLIKTLITKRNFSGKSNNKWRITVNTNKIFP